MVPARTRRQRWVVAGGCIAIFVVVPCELFRREVRQHDLNRRLIEAIKEKQDDRAIALLRDGANPGATTADDRIVTLRDVLNDYKDRILRKHRPAIAGQDEPLGTLLLYYRRATEGEASTTAFLSGTNAAGNENVPLALVDAGAPVNVSNRDGDTPLSCAALYGHHAVLARLLTRGARVDPLSKPLTQTPLMDANAQDSILLLKYGANTELTDSWGDTALYYYHAGKAKVLLDHGAKLDMQDNDMQTPLMSVCKREYEDAVPVMLARHAGVTEHNKKGATALLQAARYCNLEIVKALVRAGANVRDKDKFGNTPLIVSLQNNDANVMPWLLDHGVDINAEGTGGNTALDVAVQHKSNRRDREIKLLKRRGAEHGHSKGAWRDTHY